jgi:Cu(I)/Ag(I) efflux system membrane fusion protein
MKNKKIRIIIGAGIVVLAAVVIVVLLLKPKGGPAATGVSGNAGALQAGKPKTAAKTLYTCPMHPTYVSDKPGDCPICGMKLVPLEKDAAASDQPAPKKKTMYKSTMNPKEISDKPGKDSMGMDMVPFEVDEQPIIKKKTMYKSTMNPKEISEKPGKDSMGMDMVPFEVEETGNAPAVGGRIAVKISAERQQLIGVKFEAVAVRPIHKLIKAAGRVDYAEPNVALVNLKFDGWVERLYVDSTGRLVKKGEPLLDLYGPELVAAQQEYLLALRAQKAGGDSGAAVLKSSRDKLKFWDIPDAQIADLERTGEVKRTMTLFSPAAGFVIEKSVLSGQKIMAGENLYKIADLSRVWIYGDIYEFEIPFVKTLQDVKITLSSFPGENLAGKITYIYPYLNPETRTNRIRVEADNPSFKLKPEMFANLEIQVNYGEKPAIPTDAVIEAGDMKIAFIDRGDGYLEPREIKLGMKGDGVYEVLSGVAVGDRVVTSANFLVDSESSLKAALKQMTQAAATERKHD